MAQNTGWIRMNDGVSLEPGVRVEFQHLEFQITGVIVAERMHGFDWYFDIRNDNDNGENRVHQDVDERRIIRVEVHDLDADAGPIVGGITPRR